MPHERLIQRRTSDDQGAPTFAQPAHAGAQRGPSADFDLANINLAPEPLAGDRVAAPPATSRAPAAPTIQRRAVPSADFDLADISLAPDTGAAPDNRTGLPDQLKDGVEALSGVALDDVRVQYGSAEPAGLAALAFTRGSDIHVGPGQEQHLPHEAWHVAQQKQGRVAPTGALDGQSLNDDPALEHEADQMGALALHTPPASAPPQPRAAPAAALQLMRAADIEVGETYRYRNTAGKIQTGTLVSIDGNQYVFDNGTAGSARSVLAEADLDSASDEENDAPPAPKRQRGESYVAEESSDEEFSEGEFSDNDEPADRRLPPQIRNIPQRLEVEQESSAEEYANDDDEEIIEEAADQQRQAADPTLSDEEVGYVSDETDAEAEKPNLSGLLDRHQNAWEGGQRTLSQNAIDALIPKIKKNIAALVKEAYGATASDAPRDMDTAAASLLPEGSRNCSACIDLETADGDMKRLATYNTRQVKSTSSYNAAREDGEPKMHALGANSKFGGISLGLEHAELRGADKIAAAYEETLDDDEKYTATDALANLDYIGIFQPCCVLCAVCFAVSGKADATRGYHIKNVVGWQWPPFILADRGAVEKILGKEAVAEIGDNLTDLTRVLHHVTTHHSDWNSVW